MSGIEPAGEELSRGKLRIAQLEREAIEQNGDAAKVLRAQLWEHAVVARGPCDYEHRLRRHDGQYRYFSVHAVPVFGEDGAINPIE